jgi:hypothetical protein
VGSRRIYRFLGGLGLKCFRRSVAKGLVQPSRVVDLLDELRQPFGRMWE